MRFIPSILRSFPFNVMLYFVGFLSPPLPAAAASYDRIQTLSMDEGLPHSDVNAITQDRDGYLYFAPHHVFGLYNGFAYCTPTSLVPVFPFPARAFHMRPYSSDNAWYRNLNLLSIAYVLRPVLRPRLTQSRSALLWKP